MPSYLPHGVVCNRQPSRYVCLYVLLAQADLTSPSASHFAFVSHPRANPCGADSVALVASCKLYWNTFHGATLLGSRVLSDIRLPITRSRRCKIGFACGLLSAVVMDLQRSLPEFCEHVRALEVAATLECELRAGPASSANDDAGNAAGAQAPVPTTPAETPPPTTPEGPRRGGLQRAREWSRDKGTERTSDQPDVVKHVTEVYSLPPDFQLKKRKRSDEVEEIDGGGVGR